MNLKKNFDEKIVCPGKNFLKKSMIFEKNGKKSENFKKNRKNLKNF